MSRLKNIIKFTLIVVLAGNTNVKINFKILSIISLHVSIERMGRIILISGFLKSNSSIICVLLSRTYDLLDDHVGDHASFRI